MEKLEQDNTKPEFFAHWSHSMLEDECARLNQVLKNCSELSMKALNEASEILDTDGGYQSQKDYEESSK